MSEVHEDQGSMFERSEADISAEADNTPLEWKGLPRFVAKKRPPSLVISFDNEEDRDRLIAQLGLILAKKTRSTWSAWWPAREKEDLASLRFDFGDDEQGVDDE